MTIAALPVVVPLLAAALLAAVDSAFPRWVQRSVALVGVAGALVASLLLVERTLHGPAVTWFGGWMPRDRLALGISFTVDPVGAGLGVTTCVLSLLAVVFTWRAFDTAGSHFHVLLLVFTAALNGFGLTGDLFNLFVFFELMSVSAFALTGYKIQDDSALQGAFNFAVTNTVGAVLVLLGLAVVYGRTGALNMAQVAAAAGRGDDPAIVLAMLMMVCGFLVKGAAVPFHFWLADAHAAAPTAVCVLFSGVMVEAGVFAVARVLHSAFGGVVLARAAALGSLLVGAGVVTAVLGAVMCYAQRHLKRLLAYSTVSHVGVMLIGVGLLHPGALGGVLLYALGHAGIKAALFFCAGIVLHVCRDVDEVALHGRGRVMPITGGLMAMGGLALAALPPFGLFRGEAMLDEAAHSHGAWLGAVVVASGALTGGAVLRFVARVFAGMGPRGPVEPDVGGATGERPETSYLGRRVPWFMAITVVVTLLLAMAVGLAPGLSEAATQVASSFQDVQLQTWVVLHGSTVSVSSSLVVPDSLSGSALMRGGLTAALACGVAVTGLLGERPGDKPGLVHRGAAFIYGPLRRMHSGHMGDYVAWLLVGVAAYGAVLVLMGGLAGGPGR